MDWHSFVIGLGVASVLSLVFGLVEWHLFRQWDAARTELIAAQRRHIEESEQLLGKIIEGHPSQQLRDIWAMRDMLSRPTR